MQGVSHVGFSLAGAVTVNSLLNALFSKPLPGVADDFIHAIGSPWSYPAAVHAYHTHALLDFASLIHKVTFYIALAYCARLPDQLERRPPGMPGPKHRGFTHSCCLVIFMIGFFVALVSFGLSWLTMRRVVLSDFWVKELCACLLAVLLAIVLHIIADSLTKRKVKVMWPDETPVGLGLFSNGTAGEYAVLWGYIFLTGALVALGILAFEIWVSGYVERARL